MSTYLLIIKIASAIALWIICDLLLRGILNRAARASGLPRAIVANVGRAIRLVLTVVVLVYLAETLGVAPQNLWTGMSTLFGLIAVGFIAFWSALSNQFCGLVLLFARPFAIGDEIEIIELGTERSPARGVVIEMTPVYTVLESTEQHRARIYVPHNLVLQKTVRVFPKGGSSALPESYL